MIDGPTDNAASPGSILVVDDDASIRRLVAAALGRAGFVVAAAADGLEALARVAEAPPDLIVSDVMMPRLDGFGLVARLRADPTTRAIPVILLTAFGAPEDIVAGLELGADDYLAKPFAMAELVARVRAKILRPPVPREDLPRARRTDLLAERPFADAAGGELTRARRGGASGCLAYLTLNELPRVGERFGPQAEAQLARQAAALLPLAARPLDIFGRDAAGRFGLLLPETPAQDAERRLAALSVKLADHVFVAGEERLRLTPVIGFAPFADAASVEELRERALAAHDHAALHLDLAPVRHAPAMTARMAPSPRPRVARLRSLGRRLRFPFQVALVQLLALVVPFLLYGASARAGVDLAGPMYFVVVGALLATAALIWLEGLAALRPTDLPDEPASPYPPATAIIAAYLPNEAATIVETVEAALGVDYPAPLQVILAYNTPRSLPIEARLREIARRDGRFLPLRVAQSTSKAQNVNAALAEVTGAFVGVFDADHHPAPDSFARAWRWLSHGYDVVQGHCLVRNGDASWVARLVAVEFEAIYAVSHPGRTRLHGFGIFGGSNGYWKTSLLRGIRMRGSMLTEDIDASLRVVGAGGRIASDPLLISRELAPVTLEALWNQRMRWAQGWFQASLRHLWSGLRSRQLSWRQKAGLLQLLGWRELYPWLSVQMAPIVAYNAWRKGGVDRLDWLVPIFVLTSLFTLSTGPGQALFAYLLGAPEIRRRKRWFFFYLVASSVFYTPLKNLIAVVAQVKEVMRERQWKVTPRTSESRDDALEAPPAEDPMVPPMTAMTAEKDAGGAQIAVSTDQGAPEPHRPPTTASSTGEPSAAGRFAELEAYRGIAAILLVVFHVYQYSREGTAASAYVYEGTPLHAVFRSLQFSGWFFALSGFLLFLPFARAALAQDRPRSARGFLVRRAIRIVPPYYLAILAVWGWRYGRYPHVSGQWLDLAEHLSFTQVFDRTHIFWTIGPAWSLGDEVLFYGVVALCGTAAYRVCARLRTTRARAGLLGGMSLAMALLSIGYKVWAYDVARIPATDWPVYYGPLAKLDLLAVGMLLAVGTAAAGGRAVVPAAGAAALRVMGVAAMGLLFVWRGEAEPSRSLLVDHFFHTFAALAFALILASTVLGPRGSRWERTLRWRPLQFVGAISYSVYLWHEPLMLELGRRHWLIDPAPQAFPVNALVLVALAIAAATGSHWLVERPARRLQARFTADGRLLPSARGPLSANRWALKRTAPSTGRLRK